MKHCYTKPDINVWKIDTPSNLMAASDPETDTASVYDDDPQEPGNALARRRNIWWDDDEEE